MKNHVNLFDDTSDEQAKSLPVIWSLSPKELEAKFQVEEQMPAIPKPVKISLNDVYASYHNTLEIIGRAIHKHHLFVKSIIGDVDEKTATDNNPKNFAEGLVDILFKQAQGNNDSNVNLQINQKVELQFLKYSDEVETYNQLSRKLRHTPEFKSLIPVDLDRIQTHLENKFGGDAGARMFHQQQCEKIIKYFHLDDSESLKETSQGIVLGSAYFIRKNQWGDTTLYDFDFDRKRDLIAILNALMIFAEYMQIDGFAEELAYLSSQINHSPNLKMPTTWAQSRIKIKLFTSKKEWVLSKDIAKKLQIYIGEFQS